MSAPMPRCEKREYIGAVTLVRFSADGSLLYVGVGPTLFLYETATGEIVAQHDILTRGILHGCDIVHRVATTSGASALCNVGVFFGQKRVACFHSLPQTPADAAAHHALQCVADSNGKPRTTKVFSDWVFDVQILSRDARAHSAFPLVAVGLAHNFVQIWEPSSDSVLRTVQCAERCILYALAFHGRNAEELLVASGTVFQQILLWQPFTAALTSAGQAAAHEQQQQQRVAAPAQRLHSHDGVLFKLEWSSDASMLASVSDDRTVQLWSNRDASAFPQKSAARGTDGFLESTQQTAAIMAALLHNTEKREGEMDSAARVVGLASDYRSVFRSWGHTARLWDVKFCAYGLATTSEDAVCKVWDFAGNCIASLQGHVGRHVWRVAVHPSQAIVATGGSDSAAKLWHLHSQLKSTSSDSDAFCDSIPLFADSNRLDDIGAADGTTNSKTKGKSKTLSVRDIVVNQSHGETAYVASELGQIVVIDVKAQTSSPFFTLGDDDAATAAPAMLSAFSIDARDRFLLAGDSAGVVSIIDVGAATLLHAWQAHASRVMKVVWPRSEADRNDIGASTLFTVCADCSIREWRPVQVPVPVDSDGGNSSTLKMELVASFQSPGKCAASSLLVIDRGVTRNIVCGDGRGNVFVFHRPLAPDTAAFAVGDGDDGSGAERSPGGHSVPPNVVLRGVHGREQVTSLLLRDALVYSGGHDGDICTHTAGFGPDGALSLTLVGRDSVKGMATIKQLWFSSGELFVLGFYASQAILHNFSAQQRLFSIACGGWRRPHALVTTDAHGSASLPAHTFLFTPPVTNKADALALKVHSTLTQRAAQALTTALPSLPPPPLAKSSLHYLYHGKMTTCVVHIGHRLVTAAEDNSIKLHCQQQPCAGHATRWVCVSTGVAHTTTVRALTAFHVPGAHVLLSGGGKQRINVWRVRDDADVLEHVCGFEKDDALQDHRILGLATFAIRPSHGDAADAAANANARYRLVAACNSEGAIQLLLLDAVAGTLRELGNVSSSNKPILSCASFQHGATADDAAAILTVGSTDGMVTIWSFAGLVRELERADLATANSSTVRRLLSYLVPAEAYLAHDMGVNCLAIAHHDTTSFVVVSGGDDQNVRLREYLTGGESYEVACDARAVNASGSAIKTIWSDGKIVILGGYDQRVSKWAIVARDAGGVQQVAKAADGHMDDVTSSKSLEWQCAAFSECADIANLAVWHEPHSDGNGDAGAHVVVVVGQGLQVIRFRS